MYVDRERNNKKKLEQVVEHLRKEKESKKRRKKKVLMGKNKFTKKGEAKVSHELQKIL